MPQQYYCCVNTCDSSSIGVDRTNYQQSKLRFFKFPTTDLELQARWIQAVDRGPNFQLTPSTVVCSKHFQSGKKSLNPNSVDYVPTLIEPPLVPGWQKQSYCGKCRKLVEACACTSPEEGQQSTTPKMPAGSRGRGGGRGRGRGRGRPSYTREASSSEEEAAAATSSEEEEEEEEAPTPEPADDSPDEGAIEPENDDDWAPDQDDEPPAAKKRRGRPPSTNGRGRGTGRGRGRRSAAATEIPVVTVAPASSSPEIIPPTIVTPTEANARAQNSTAVIPKTPVKRVSSGAPAPLAPPSNAKLMERIRDLETESALKIEQLQRSHNMKIAALKEDFAQRIHRMKTEWENEKANLMNELEICKSALEQSGISTSAFLNVQSGAGVGNPGNIQIIIPTATEEHLQ